MENWISLINCGIMQIYMAKSLASKINPLKKLRLTNSPKFAEIMQKYDAFGKHMSKSAFYNSHIQLLDPTITLRQWTWFIDKFQNMSKEYVSESLKKSVESSVNEAKVEQNAVGKVLQISDAALQDMMDNPALLQSVSLEKRVSWLFSAMKARDTRLKTNIMARADERQQSMFEKMMEGAQYGGFDASDIPTVEAMAEEKTYEPQPVSHELPGAV